MSITSVGGFGVSPDNTASVSVPRTEPARRASGSTTVTRTFAAKGISPVTPDKTASVSTDKETNAMKALYDLKFNNLKSRICSPQAVSTKFLVEIAAKEKGLHAKEIIEKYLKDNHISIDDNTFVNVHYLGHLSESADSSIINLIEANGKYFSPAEERIYDSIPKFLSENKFGSGKYVYYETGTKSVKTFTKEPSLGEKAGGAVTNIALASLLVPILVTTGAVLATEAAPLAAAATVIGIGSTYYFGVQGALSIKDNYEHGVRDPGKYVADAVWVGLSMAHINGGIGRAALKLLAEGGKAHKAVGMAIKLSDAVGTLGAITLMGQMTAEMYNVLQEIGKANVPAQEKAKMALYAAIQMGLVAVGIKGAKISLKDGRLPADLMPKAASQLKTDKILFKQFGGNKYLKNIWDRTVAKGTATAADIKRFYETAKSAGAARAKDAQQYLSHLYSTGSQALKNSLIIFAHENNLAIIPEVRVRLLATVDGRTVKGPSEIGFRKPYESEVDHAQVFFAAKKQKAQQKSGSSVSPQTIAAKPAQASGPAATVVPITKQAQTIFTFVPGRELKFKRSGLEKIFGKNDKSWQQFFEPFFDNKTKKIFTFDNPYERYYRFKHDFVSKYKDKVDGWITNGYQDPKGLFSIAPIKDLEVKDSILKLWRSAVQEYEAGGIPPKFWENIHPQDIFAVSKLHDIKFEGEAISHLRNNPQQGGLVYNAIRVTIDRGSYVTRYGQTGIRQLTAYAKVYEIKVRGNGRIIGVEDGSGLIRFCVYEAQAHSQNRLAQAAQKAINNVRP